MNILILYTKAFSSIQKFISFFLLIFKEMKTVSWAPTRSWALGTAPSGRSDDRPGDLTTCIKFMLKKKKPKQERTCARLYPHRALQERHKRDWQWCLAPGRKTGWPEARMAGSYYCMPFCAFGILYCVNESPIHKSK